MDLITVKKCLLLTGIAWCVVIQPVKAEIEAQGIEGLEGDRPSDTDILYLSEIDLPLTTVEAWTAELAQSTVVPIVGVQFNTTETGVEMLFNTADGQLATPTTSVVGNALIADIPNAVLRLPEGDELQAADPAAGIALITVSNLPDERVRVVITGSESPPNAEFGADTQALIVNVFTVSSDDAEQADVEDAIQIVVTAERIPDEVQDVPISLTVLTEEQLEDAQIDSLEGISQNAPNFIFFPSSPGNTSSYTVRGLGNNNFLGRDAVGFFINGVPYDSGFFFDTLLTDLERVEVLRGPQNILYGRSSIAGVVNIITRPPSDDLEIRSAASYGNENLINLQLSVSDTVASDTFGFRVAGAFNRQGGLVDNVFLDENVGDRTEGSGFADLRWTPSENWEISLINTVRSSDNDGFTNQIEPFVAESNEIGFVQLNSNSQALKIAYNQPTFQVNSTTTRRFTNFERQLDADGTSDDRIRFPLETNTTVWSQEFRVQSPDDAERFRWLVGGYYEARNFESDGGFDLIGSGLSLTVTDLEQDTFAGFGQIDYKPIENLTLTTGLRYETNETHLDRDRRFEVPGGDSFPIGLDVDGEEQRSSAVLPRFAVEYRFNPNVVTYASATRGYRPGGLNFNTDFPEALEFDEETSWNFELGVKTTWLNDRVRANVAVFTNDVNDYQVALFDEAFLSSTVSNADVRINGFELELGAVPTQGLDVVAGFGFLDDEFTDFFNPLTGEDSSGNRLPFTPRFNYNLSVQYLASFGLLSRLELQGFGNYFFDEGNQFEQGPFALVNARLGYEHENYGVYLFVNNLFNTEYLVEQFGVGNRFSSFGDRRTFGVQVRASI
ncbi:MAG: TonB-dependent receptor [Cyanobacteria bacterium P01_E01_bin.6]